MQNAPTPLRRRARWKSRVVGVKLLFTRHAGGAFVYGVLRVAVLGLKQIDNMIDLAIARVSEGPDGARRAVSELATRWPNATGLQIVFVMVSAGHAIERVFTGENDTPNTETAQALRMASLLSVDLFAMEKRGNFSPTGADLLDYWREADPFFIEPPLSMQNRQLAG